MTPDLHLGSKSIFVLILLALPPLIVISFPRCPHLGHTHVTHKLHLVYTWLALGLHLGSTSASLSLHSGDMYSTIYRIHLRDR